MRNRVIISALLAAACAIDVSGQASVPEPRTGSVTMTLQRVHVFHHTNWMGGIDRGFGKIRSNTLTASIDYGVADRTALTISLPYVSAVYHGSVPESAIDDGRYHGTLQDVAIDVRHAFFAGSAVLTPFASISLPTRDYPVHGHAAAGRRLRELSAGFYAARDFAPHAPDVQIQLKSSYTRVAKVLGMRLDRGTIVGDAAYLATSRIALHGSVNWIRGFGGLEIPKDLEDPRHADHLDEIDAAHDRAARADYLFATAGVSWRAAPSIDLFAGFTYTARSENAHIGNGVTIGARWSFGRKRSPVYPQLPVR